MSKRSKLLASLLLALVYMAISASPVLAIDEPTSVSVEDVEVFEDTLVTGDMLFIVPYDIPIASVPSGVDLSEAFIFRLMSPDGGTENGSVLANPAYNSGWGRGVVSFYFASGMVADSAYIVRVQQNPVHYPTATYWDFTLSSASYSSASDVSAAIRTKVILEATPLTNEFNVALLTTSEAGNTVLSTAGELYFLEAIPALQNMSPELFGVQLEDPDYTKRSWSHSFANALRNKYAGTMIGEFFTGFAGLFSTEVTVGMSFLSFIMAALVILFSVWKGKASMIAAMSDGYAFLLLLMLLGIFPMEAAGGIAFLSTAAGGLVLLFNRS